MKKIVSILTAVLIISSISATTVFAHGHCGSKNASVSKATKYAVCTVEECLKTKLHSHSGEYASAHYYGDGHDYHEYCDVENCTVDGYHEHNGEYCFAN